MLIVRRVGQVEGAPDAFVELPFDKRTLARLRTTASNGEEIGLFLPRGTVLRDSDGLHADDGRVVQVIAAPERLLEVRADDPQALVRAAYHLGNRHATVEIGDGSLRCPVDVVLATLLAGLGLAVTEVIAPFQPEPGAYAAGAHAHAANSRHAGVIHDFAEAARRGGC